MGTVGGQNMGAFFEFLSHRTQVESVKIMPTEPPYHPSGGGSTGDVIAKYNVSRITPHMVNGNVSVSIGVTVGQTRRMAPVLGRDRAEQAHS